MEPESDEDPDYLPSRKRGRDEGDEVEDAGRYDIGNREPSGSSKKRSRVDGRRSTRETDEKAVFTTDDDDDDEGGSVEHELSSDEREDREYDLEDKQGGSKKVGHEERRSYWLSKGIGVGDYDSS